MKLFSLLLENRPGALDRITGLIRRCGWNIEEIIASKTRREGVTLMTISVMSKGMSDETFRRKFAELECVQSFDIYSSQTHLLREMVLIRSPGELTNPQLRKIGDENGVIVYEFSGTPDDVAALIQSLHESVEYTRTGGLIIRK